jgi:uncharacterized protein (DUF2132 family)
MHLAVAVPTLRGGPPDGMDEMNKDPLHGVTLAHMVEDLSDYYGWSELGRLIPVRCFTHDPSVSSSLKFLRRTPWARAKVEALYLETWRRAQAAKGRE